MPSRKGQRISPQSLCSQMVAMALTMGAPAKTRDMTTAGEPLAPKASSTEKKSRANTPISIAEDVEDSGSYDWEVPLMATMDGLLRISSADDRCVSDVSNARFSIKTLRMAGKKLPLSPCLTEETLREGWKLILTACYRFL